MSHCFRNLGSGRFWPHNHGLKHAVLWFPLLTKTRRVFEETHVRRRDPAPLFTKTLYSATMGTLLCLFPWLDAQVDKHHVLPQNHGLKHSVFWFPLLVETRQVLLRLRRPRKSTWSPRHLQSCFLIIFQLRNEGRSPPGAIHEIGSCSVVEFKINGAMNHLILDPQVSR
ncbi:hypothetical protein M427DRAFT_408983 [Gonapodya prolifera JEL478]|uniref:Uncharacterized protein n=1 Tax=Gonapodya prolifera (strain JEL478) TaxID=1344416 RepID=A0A139A5V5_GONPJ|nr:hypothetical protein M427DRAFT_408983 [Gonapodya prolifera JEL478]|eukprot:KXS12212.1 hypothetical protein M427DRAFT_408983 [Gonapodya prolifera JEL478]